MNEMHRNKFTVTFFHRKPRAVGNYSVEFIFNDVRARLVDKIQANVVESPYESSGLFKRIYNCIDAFFKQGRVNHITGDINYLGLLLSRKRTIHTVLDCVHLNTSSGWKYRILKLFWLTIPEKRSKFFTAISESTKQEILKHCSCDPDKIKVIPVAISPGYTYYPKAFNEKSPNILQIGTAPNKNIPNLIEAIKGMSCHLQIIGRWNLEYEELLKKNKIQFSYDWDLTEDQMIEKYRQADIISLVSTYEGFGMPILEGQAIGRPVITSNLYSMPEVAGHAACIVDPFDPQDIRKGLLNIMLDNTYRNELIQKGFENCKRFDPDIIANQYFNLYEKVFYQA